MRRYACLTAFIIALALVAPGKTEAITFSPPLFEFDAVPGKELKGEITLYNESAETKILYASLENFRPKGDGGQPEFVSWQDHELADWITLAESRVELAPKVRRRVSFTINVPRGAISGGHYGAIFWSSSPSTDGGAPNVAVVAKTGALIMARVTPGMIEAGELNDFSTDSSRYESPPVKFFVRFENKGTVHLKPIGAVTVKNIFGKIVATLPVNPYGGRVLPQSIRNFDAIWKIGENEEPSSLWKLEKENFFAGRYTAELSLFYGDEGREIKAVKNFWILPWRAGGILGGAILGGFVIVASSFKRYNRWIIRRYLRK